MPSRVRQRQEMFNVVPVRMAVADFLACVEVKRLRPKTQDEYGWILMLFADWCGRHSMSQNKTDGTWSVVPVKEHRNAIMLHRIDAQVVHLFLEYIKRTSKPSKADQEELSSYTLNQHVKNIKRFLNWCMLDELYSTHVKALTVQRIKKPKIEATVMEVFSEDDIDRLFAACDKERYEHLRLRDRAMLALLLDTGIRANELVTLTIGNTSLDTRDPYIRVFGKGQKWGEVGMGEKTRRILQRYIRQFREPTIEATIEKELRKLPPRAAQESKKQALRDARLFVNRAAQPLTVSGLHQIIERLGVWSGIKDVRCSPHTFRHTFSVLFMRNGGDIYQLSKLLRHSSVKVTELYLKALRQAEARRGAKSVMDNL
jgi:integrase/recombinase XerD